MNLKLSRTLLITTFLLGAAPAFAEGITVISPGSDTAVTTEGAVAVEPGSTVVLEPGQAVVVTESVPVNVGLEGIVAWGTTAMGPAWVDIKGMALYNYDQDKDGKSACNGDCAASWMPLVAASDAMPVDEWTPITREDGTKQWAFRGVPLYTFVKDTMPGEVNGDGAAGFHLAD